MVENHVNVLRLSGGDPVRVVALAAVLNTHTVDQVFRCISGSVAVSASELHSLPLPPREVFDEVSALLAEQPEEELLPVAVEKNIETLVERAYGSA